MASIRHYDGECNCADNMLTDCGCVAHVYSDGSGVDMEFCEIHSGITTLVSPTYDSLVELAKLVAADYPDAADWKDARGRLLSLAQTALAGIPPTPADPVRQQAMAALQAVLDYHRNPERAEQIAYDATAGNVTALDALLGQVEAALDNAKEHGGSNG